MSKRKKDTPILRGLAAFPLVPPPVERPPLIAPGTPGLTACERLCEQAGIRASRETTETPWKPPAERSLQGVKHILPHHNADGGPRGLSPTETPALVKKNRFPDGD